VIIDLGSRLATAVSAGSHGGWDLNLRAPRPNAEECEQECRGGEIKQIRADKVGVPRLGQA
jgi:hypothetical protein